MLRAFSVQVPVGVAFAKSSGMVVDGRPDEFEAPAGPHRSIRIRPDLADEALYSESHASTGPEALALKVVERLGLETCERLGRQSGLRPAP